MPSIEKLTDKFVRAVRTNLAQEEFWDGSRPGLFLRVGRQGTRSFFYSYRQPGAAPVRQRPKKTLPLGRFNPDDPEESRRLTLAQAVAAWRVAAGKVADGIDPRAARAVIDRQVPRVIPLAEGVPLERQAAVRRIFGGEVLVSGSFGELARAYLLLHAWPEKRRARDDEQMLQRDLLPRWRDLPAAAISRREVVILTDHIAARGARVAANHVRLLVSRIYNFGIGKVKVEHNPAHLVKISGGKGSPGVRWLSDDEIRTLWHGVEGFGNPVFRAQVRVLLVLVQRPGEVAAMERAEIRDGWWLIPGEKRIPYAGREVTVGTKNGLPHGVYLPPLARQEIEPLLALHGGRFVFPSPMRDGQALLQIYRSLERLVHKLGMRHFTPQDLRRTGTTNLQRLGVSEAVIDAVVNHVPRGVRRHYNLWHHHEERKEAMLRWEAHLRGIL